MVDIEFNFTTRNYMKLQEILKVDNLREALLKAAAVCNYEVLAKGIKQFAATEVKGIDGAYDIIDEAEDKQLLFYEFISELGEHGFFDKGTTEELKKEALQPQIDVASIVNKIAPDMVKETLKERENTKTGANTFEIYEANATNAE